MPNKVTTIKQSLMKINKYNNKYLTVISLHVARDSHIADNLKLFEKQEFYIRILIFPIIFINKTSIILISFPKSSNIIM